MAKAKGLLEWIDRSVDELMKMGFPESVAKRISSGELPMDEASRLARAKAQNFRKPTMYHGTGSDIPEIDPSKLQSRDAGVLGEGFYSTQAPAIANQYARLAERIGGDSPNIIPLMVRKGNYAQYNLADKGDLAVQLAKDKNFSKSITDSLKSQGYIGADVRDASGGIVERVNFNPNDVRSIFAAFDPEYTGPNILGSRIAPTAAAGLLGTMALTQSEDAEAAGLPKFVKVIPKTLDDTGEALYRGGHTAPIDPEYHSPLFDVTQKGTYPSDIYSSVGQRYYGHGDPAVDAESFAQIRKARNNPEAQINVYRAVPDDAPDDLNVGDWVSTSKQYAIQHGEGLDNYKILEAKVPASKLRTDGNSPHEWGYTGAGLLPVAAAGLLGLGTSEDADAAALEAGMPMAMQAGGQSAMDSKPDLGRDVGTLIGLLDFLLPFAAEFAKPATMGNAELTEEQRRQRKYYGQ